MKTSDVGLTFTSVSEGREHKAYKDTGGVWTIGVGHTGPDVYKGLMADDLQILVWLKEDIKDAEEMVGRLVTVALTQGQYDALVDFAFNVGEDQFDSSTLLRKLNQGDYAGAANEFKRWVHDDGKVQPGLVKRAMGRRDMFLGLAV